VKDTPAVMRNDEEAVEHGESERRHGKEVHRDNGFTTVAQKCRPSLRRLGVRLVKIPFGCRMAQCMPSAFGVAGSSSLDAMLSSISEQASQNSYRRLQLFPSMHAWVRSGGIAQME
jgi:hypothetical protein